MLQFRIKISTLYESSPLANRSIVCSLAHGYVNSGEGGEREIEIVKIGFRACAEHRNSVTNSICSLRQIPGHE